MNAHMHDLLLILDRAKLNGGDGWVSAEAVAHVPQHTRHYAQQTGKIEGKGRTNNRQYRITSAGRTALAKNAEANLAVMDKLENGFIPTGEPIDDLTRVEPAAPLSHLPGLDAELKPGLVRSLGNAPAPEQVIRAVQQKNAQPAITELPPYAEACVKAVEILTPDFPEVGDLVDALMKLHSRKAGSHE